MTDWDPTKYIGFDFETSGSLPEYALQPWRVAQKKAWVTSLVWITPDKNITGVHGGLNPTKGQMELMLRDAIDMKRRIVGWNVTFDIQWLLAYGLADLVFQCKWLDGMLLWKHATVEPEYDLDRSKKKSYKLKEMVRELYPDEAGYEEEIDFHDESTEARAKLHAYNIKDVDFTLRGAAYWWARLNNRQQTVAMIEAECLPHVARANLQGLPLDYLAARDLQQHLLNEADTALLRLAPLGIDEKVARSPKKLAVVMYDDWKLPVIKHTATGNRACDKEVLHELALGYNGSPPDSRVKVLRTYRESLNQETKFARAAIDSADYNADGCVHPQAIVFSTYTGRLAYASKQGKNKDERPIGYAVHQEKRQPEFRQKIIPPLGYTIVEFDASGQEFRWFAEASGDVTMRSLCEPGEDAHSFLGARIAEVNYRQLIAAVAAEEAQGLKGEAYEQRRAGKVGNLSLQYRTSYQRLLVTARVDYGIPWTVQQAMRVHATYPQTYPGVPKYWKRQIDLTKANGYVETLAGRRVKVVGDWGQDYWRMGSTGINYRIQGTGADQKYLALACLQETVRRYAARFALDLHDGLYFFVPNDLVHAFVESAQNILDNLPYNKAWGFTPSIPLPWDCKIGGSWGDLKGYKHG